MDVGGAVVLVDGAAHARHVRVVTRAEAAQELHAVHQRVRCGRRVPASARRSLNSEQYATALDDIAAKLASFVAHILFLALTRLCFYLGGSHRSLPSERVVRGAEGEVAVRGVTVRPFSVDRCLFVCWPDEDKELGMRIHTICCENYPE